MTEAKEIVFSYREREILKLRKEGFTLQEISRIYKVTRERVRQIEQKAKSKRGDVL